MPVVGVSITCPLKQDNAFVYVDRVLRVKEGERLCFAFIIPNWCDTTGGFINRNSDVELWNGTLSSGQSLTVPGISKYRAIYATIQGYKRVMFLSDTQSGFCGASAQGAQLSMSRLDISGDTVTFSGMTINFNPDGSVSDTVIPECTRISGYLTKITIS